MRSSECCCRKDMMRFPIPMWAIGERNLVFCFLHGKNPENPLQNWKSVIHFPFSRIYTLSRMSELKKNQGGENWRKKSLQNSSEETRKTGKFGKRWWRCP